MIPSDQIKLLRDALLRIRKKAESDFCITEVIDFALATTSQPAVVQSEITEADDWAQAAAETYEMLRARYCGNIDYYPDNQIAYVEIMKKAVGETIYRMKKWGDLMQQERDHWHHIAESSTVREYGKPDFVTALANAEKIVKAYPLYRKFIDGTPLENDIAVWMAEFAVKGGKP